MRPPTSPDSTELHAALYSLGEVIRMGQPVPNPPPGFDELTVDEQITYVQSLWDRIAATPEQVPVPDWHRRVLEERLASTEGSQGARPWPEVRENLKHDLGLDSTE